MKKQDPAAHQRKQVRCSCSMVVLTFAIALMAWTPLVGQNSCQPVLDAMNKIYTTPSHLYNTMDGDRTNELIYAAGAVYDNLHGKWARSRVPLQRVMELEENNRRNSKYTCRYLRDESVNGEMAAVYSTHAAMVDL